MRSLPRLRRRRLKPGAWRSPSPASTSPRSRRSPGRGPWPSSTDAASSASASGTSPSCSRRSSPAAVPGRRRPRLPDAGSHAATLVRRRGAAHPAGHPDRAALMGVLYILDEPSIGLHQRDNQRLIETLQRLRDLGNTVIVVEHDEETMERPTGRRHRAGRRRARRARSWRQGTPADDGAPATRSPATTCRAARRSRCPPTAAPGHGKALIVVKGAAENNLKDVDVEFPLGHVRRGHRRVGLGQVDARSTRSSTARWRGAATAPATVPGRHQRITGIEHLDKVIDIDQSPIGRTPRSNPATYTRCSTPSASCSRRCPRRKVARLQAGPLLLQRQGRALRGLRGRRHDEDRDALPARRVRALRGVRRASATTARRCEIATRARTSPRCWR